MVVQRHDKLSDNNISGYLTKYGIKFCWCNRPSVNQSVLFFNMTYATNSYYKDHKVKTGKKHNKR